MREEWEIIDINSAPGVPEECLRISTYPGRAITISVQSVENGVATVLARIEHDPDHTILARLVVLRAPNSP